MADIFNLTDTWNNAGTTFNAIKMNVTNTASGAGSKLLDLQVGSLSVFNVGPTGTLHVGSGEIISGEVGGFLRFNTQNISARSSHAMFYTGAFQVVSLGHLGFVDSSINALSGTLDTALFRDVAGALAQRNSTNPQTFRVYNTYTDASNYERAVFDWSTTPNTLTIGTEKAGTGTARDVVVKSASTTVAMDVAGGGSVIFRVGGVAVANASNSYLSALSGALSFQPGPGLPSLVCDGSTPILRVANTAGGDASLKVATLHRSVPVTKTADFAVAATDSYLICNKGSAGVITLPAAASYTGREISFTNIQAFAWTSASSNVVPRAGGSAGTAILPATDGAWCKLVSDGTNWINLQGTP